MAIASGAESGLLASDLSAVLPHRSGSHFAKSVHFEQLRRLGIWALSVPYGFRDRQTLRFRSVCQKKSIKRSPSDNFPALRWLGGTEHGWETEANPRVEPTGPGRTRLPVSRDAFLSNLRLATGDLLLKLQVRAKPWSAGRRQSRIATRPQKAPPGCPASVRMRSSGALYRRQIFQRSGR